MQTATFALAVLGLVLSIASLTWQAATFVLSGTRLQCELRMGAVNRTGGYMTLPATTWRGLTDAMTSQGFTRVRVFIVVRNTGRLATSVTSYKLQTNTGQTYGTTRPESWEEPLPRRLEPGDSEEWSLAGEDTYAMVEAIRETPELRVKAKGGVLEIRAVVEDGAGRRITSKEALKVPLESPAAG